jgi:hypothetical protein
MSRVGLTAIATSPHRLHLPCQLFVGDEDCLEAERLGDLERRMQRESPGASAGEILCGAALTKALRDRRRVYASGINPSARRKRLVNHAWGMVCHVVYQKPPRCAGKSRQSSAPLCVATTAIEAGRRKATWSDTKASRLGWYEFRGSLRI